MMSFLHGIFLDEKTQIVYSETTLAIDKRGGQSEAIKVMVYDDMR
jgi:hypothetical protein